ncbi:MSF1-domain-containing protein [Acaromyces ingoldii]|uniref:MSF1-domain-containing protein n=1 Tax=Acaromyces ingoldii TaxID=215250 RepID=A0A316YMV8_9BASI|nr:MSF1-domain-containing protein [Acaromyces ingoldii]PWN89998.1 MSF1-domain-containing protein [Acaromyces ingoldii]
MPQTFVNSFPLPFPWSHTALSVWHKYPNPSAPHVVSMDTLSHQYDDQTGLLRIERILGVRQGAPTWAVKLLGGTEDTYVREVTMIDSANERFEMTSTNLSLSAYLLVKEYITYLPASPTTSVFNQTALITCSAGSGGGFIAKAAQKIEDWSHKRFGDNAEKGKMGLEHVCKQLWESRWQQSDSSSMSAARL